MRREYEGAGKERLFEAIKGSLIGGEPRRPYREVARELGMSEGAVKLSVHRLRRHYGRVLRREVAQTVERPEETDEELRYLLSVLTK